MGETDALLGLILAAVDTTDRVREHQVRAHRLRALGPALAPGRFRLAIENTVSSEHSLGAVSSEGNFHFFAFLGEDDLTSFVGARKMRWPVPYGTPTPGTPGAPTITVWPLIATDKPKRSPGAASAAVNLACRGQAPEILR